jgi:predicted PurR-regulated permease PerM
MVEKEAFNQIIIYALVIGLFVLAFLVLKPIAFAIIYGMLLAYIFYPIHAFIVRKIKSETISALLVSLGVLITVIAIFIVSFWALLNQGIDFYLTIQNLNIGESIAKSFPSFLANSKLAPTIVSSINSSFSKLISTFLTELGNLVLNLPNLIVQFLVMAFIFFFGLKDGERAAEYLKSLLPLKRETQNRFFKHFEDLTKSVLVGQVVVGIIQGLVAGVGYFIFGVPNALLLTVLTTLLSILPLIGPWIVWIPVDVYLFVIGREGAGLGLLIYGLLLINWIEVIMRPIIVSRRTQINEAIIFIGMMGGIYFYGIVGLIIGPLMLAYVLLVLELYRKHNIEENIVFHKAEG